MWAWRLAYQFWDGLGTIWRGVAMLSVLAGLIAFYALWPSITIEPRESFDKIDPLETRFTAINKSIYGLSDVHYDCIFKPKYIFQNTINPRVGYQAFSIDANDSLSLYCGPSLWQFKNTPSALLVVTVMYKIPIFSHEFYQGALFVMKRDATNEVHWLPFGIGMTSVEAIKYLHDHDPP
jgi:hypothetical protein